jgi:sulfate permease, SulP family
MAELVPMAALAALLIVAGYQGLRIQQAQMIWNTSKISTAAMVLTFLATLFMPLHYAVLLGVIFSLLLHVIGQANQVKIMHLALVPGGFPEERPVPNTLPSDQFTVLHISGSLFFAAAKTLEKRLPSADDTHNAVVALILRGQPEVGSTFLNVLRRYLVTLRAHNCKLMLVGVDPALRDQLARTGMLQTLGEENVFLATQQIAAGMNAAAAAAQEWFDQPSPSKKDR